MALRQRTLSNMDAEPAGSAGLKPRYRVLLADDHQEMRSRIRAMLSAGHDVVGEVSNGFSVVAAVRELRPDVLILDITMPGKSGFEVLRQLAAEGVRVTVMIVTHHALQSYLAVAREKGARGYVIKRRLCTDLLPALAQIGSGGTFTSPGLA